MSKTNLRVFYCYTRLTKKLIRKRELAILFENGYTYKNDKYITRHFHLVFTRNQTESEMKGVDELSRVFTKYSFMIDSKKYKGDIEKVLQDNFVADENHVSNEIRLIIKDKLRKAFYEFYNHRIR